MNKITIGAVDDNVKLLASLKENLGLFSDIEIIWSANRGNEAVAAYRQQAADIILMDIEMPEMDGVEATQKIKEEFPEAKIIMLTVFDNSDKIFESILAGASGYMLKDSPPVKIHQAIHEAIEGGAPMSPIIASKALQLINKLHVKKADDFTPPSSYELTQRELEILQQITSGLNYNEIAEKLFISPKTVRNHIQNIYQKLHISSKAEAINLVNKNKWF